MRTALTFTIAAALFWGTSMLFSRNWQPEIERFNAAIETGDAGAAIAASPPFPDIGFAVAVSSAVSLIPWGYYLSRRKIRRGERIGVGCFLGILAALTLLPALGQEGGGGYVARLLVHAAIGSCAGYFFGSVIARSWARVG